MEHHDRLRRKLAVRRGEDYDLNGLALAEKVMEDAYCAVDGA